jgi:hypothetical protein
MSRARDIFDIRNLGEFAFAMAAMGMVLMLISFVLSFLILLFSGIHVRAYLVLLTIAIWFLMNLPLFKMLRQRASLWQGEQRASKQVAYVEWCSVTMLICLSWLGKDAEGTKELILVLEYLFSSWLLSLLSYQFLLHRIMKYKIDTKDAIRWGVMLVYTTANLVAKSFW